MIKCPGITMCGNGRIEIGYSLLNQSHTGKHIDSNTTNWITKPIPLR